MALHRFFPLFDWTQILIIRRFHYACRFSARVNSHFQLLTYQYIARATLTGTYWQGNPEEQGDQMDHGNQREKLRICKSAGRNGGNGEKSNEYALWLRQERLKCQTYSYLTF